MSDANKHNLHYFESGSMKGLYKTMQEWQKTNGKRLLSTSIQQESGRFCCIALSNPSEVIICHGKGVDQASVEGGELWVTTSRGDER
jgi:hypothetical protein